MTVSINIPLTTLAALANGAAEAEELRHGALQAAETMAAQQAQIHDLSQERLRESERATRAEQAVQRIRDERDEARDQRDEARTARDQALQDLGDARDEQHQTALDLENMTAARDTLRDELAKHLPAPAEDDATERPLEVGERVRLLTGQGNYRPGIMHGGELGGVIDLGENNEHSVHVAWDMDNGPAEPGDSLISHYTDRKRLERA